MAAVATIAMNRRFRNGCTKSVGQTRPLSFQTSTPLTTPSGGAATTRTPKSDRRLKELDNRVILESLRARLRTPRSVRFGTKIEVVHIPHDQPDEIGFGAVLPQQADLEL